ncbi:Eco57I restriction-modification methylase domain-containing protein [Flexistipes sp.]|uniref:Eco57I restriction-modification methylase domain-containing protein n=1 Tax=Flexistipes sp. TaxID=3088135 RepID=UPI002E1CBD2E|nr:TaqI-like C-terminal specificity domain-containing protein [Flexistipes sp.]
MDKKVIEDLCAAFDIDKLVLFFRKLNSKFTPSDEDFSEWDDENFTEISNLGRIKFSEVETLSLFSLKSTFGLTEKSSKKRQFDKAKKILKDCMEDAGIFVFYDESGNFRMSLIFQEFSGTKAEFSNYKRFTYYVSPSLTNKTFIKQMSLADFSSLESIKEAFSVEKVTKQFYDEIANWYFWSLDSVIFPDDYKFHENDEKDKEIRNAQNMIRLITRIIFVWFLKEKDLVSSNLFDSKFIEKIVKDFNKTKDSTNYYNAILQNLFFGTLNRNMSERKFANNGNFHENRSEYGVKNLYRYNDKFLISEESALSLFSEIPFLNGGLFDCLDKEDENGRVVYIDGFSRNPKKTAQIPDFLFFNKEEKKVDLSKYGIGKDKQVRGLFDILNNYNFVTDENTPVDQEIALDPELLGKVFENLLASFNPETSTTARKETGSYYTPREIVDFMVDESLTEYLKTKLPEINEDKIKLLISYSDEKVELKKEEKETLINSIDSIKIIDPACGSGAFPMGILHKLVHMLQKIDHDNKLWQDLQYKKALRETENTFKTENDKSEREEQLKVINEVFDLNINSPDYARKLYLIENCIYGVDIQPIAVQIAKLRFFISLIVDEEKDDSRENRGILALPNLETKFVAANTLIPLDQEHIFYTKEVEEIEDKLKDIRHRYFNAKTRTEKKRLREKDIKLRNDLKSYFMKFGTSADFANKVAEYDIFDQNVSADWFHPEWMFGVKGGFDILIGNPPYIQLQKNAGKLANALSKLGYETFARTGDIYVIFYERGWQLLKKGGHLTYITSNKWMRADYGKKLRRFLSNKANPKLLIDLAGVKVFKSATVDTNILTFQRGENNHKCYAVTFGGDYRNENFKEYVNTKGFLTDLFKTGAPWIISNPVESKLKEKIENIGTPLKDWDINIYRGVLTGCNEAFVIDGQTKDRLIAEDPKSAEIIKPLLRGRDIKRYHADFADRWLINSHNGYKSKDGFIPPININNYPAIKNHLDKFYPKIAKRQDKGVTSYNLRNCAYIEEFEKEKIVYNDICQKLTFALAEENIYFNNTVYFMCYNTELKYLLGLLNSNLIDWYYRTLSVQLGEKAVRMFSIYVENIPIPAIDAANASFVKNIKSTVKNILNKKKNNPKTDTTELEHEIDKMIYDLYDLTDDEIKIIEKDL